MRIDLSEDNSGHTIGVIMCPIVIPSEAPLYLYKQVFFPSAYELLCEGLTIMTMVWHDAVNMSESESRTVTELNVVTESRSLVGHKDVTVLRRGFQVLGCHPGLIIAGRQCRRRPMVRL